MGPAASDQVSCGERGKWAEFNFQETEARDGQTWWCQTSAFHKPLKWKIGNFTQLFDQIKTLAQTTNIIYSYQHFTKERTCTILKCRAFYIKDVSFKRNGLSFMTHCNSPIFLTCRGQHVGKIKWVKNNNINILKEGQTRNVWASETKDWMITSFCKIAVAEKSIVKKTVIQANPQREAGTRDPEARANHASLSSYICTSKSPARKCIWVL